MKVLVLIIQNLTSITIVHMVVSSPDPLVYLNYVPCEGAAFRQMTFALAGGSGTSLYPSLGRCPFFVGAGLSHRKGLHS